MQDNTFLGRGWSFPPRFDFVRNAVVMVEEDEDIAESLRLILSTMQGERIMDPKFGSTLATFVFDSIDSLFINRIKDSIRTAILHHEPRVTLDEITVNTTQASEGVVYATLFYTIRKINVRSNMVYPFYFKEGTNIQHP
ncbi:GPW/gp25 family protein [Parachryseolinea silvisoli]|jgi:uncharacterized protein|uniref:GPW/gp25 family protein n=1 Tax=Parachryseolinea silvisoli TaxID=2873601 RepID=UPI002265C6D1|nr:GPW/gp25 family protein [Parachryseolinea silvisoli]MCD9019680.1 GPW/gp25 family protein [Parachryseolinea silvisoli]